MKLKNTKPSKTKCSASQHWKGVKCHKPYLVEGLCCEHYLKLLDEVHKRTSKSKLLFAKQAQGQ